MWNDCDEALDLFELVRAYKRKRANKEACRRCQKEYKKSQKKYRLKIKWWQKIFGYCPWCCRYLRYNIKTVRRNSQYHDPRNNWITGCWECRENDFEYFNDLWNQYYSDCL